MLVSHHIYFRVFLDILGLKSLDHTVIVFYKIDSFRNEKF